jgi:hypothetical protein
MARRRLRKAERETVDVLSERVLADIFPFLKMAERGIVRSLTDAPVCLLEPLVHEIMNRVGSEMFYELMAQAIALGAPAQIREDA